MGPRGEACPWAGHGCGPTSPSGGALREGGGGRSGAGSDAPLGEWARGGSGAGSDAARGGCARGGSGAGSDAALAGRASGGGCGTGVSTTGRSTDALSSSSEGNGARGGALRGRTGRRSGGPGGGAIELVRATLPEPALPETRRGTFGGGRGGCDMLPPAGLAAGGSTFGSLDSLTVPVPNTNSEANKALWRRAGPTPSPVCVGSRFVVTCPNDRPTTP